MRSEAEIRALLAEAEKEWGSEWFSGYRHALKVVLDPEKEFPLGIPGVREVYKGDGVWEPNDPAPINTSEGESKPEDSGG